MKLPLTPAIVQFLKKQGYQICLCKVEELASDADLTLITLLSFQKSLAAVVTGNYEYLLLPGELEKLSQSKNDPEVFVILKDEEVIKFKQFLLEQTEVISPEQRFRLKTVMLSSLL